MKSPVITIRGIAIASVLVLAGCAGTTTPKGGIVKSDEYEYVTPLGSNIPVLVRKGQTATTSSPTESISGEQAANSIHGAGGQMAGVRGTP